MRIIILGLALMLGAAFAQGESDWVENIKFKGDLRTRYQTEEQESLDYIRERMRIRARIGMLGTLTEEFSAGIGLCSGGDDPRSTNQTFDDANSTKGINLDYAYFVWDPNSIVTVQGGKMIRKNILWQPSDLIWDGDINPEGFALLLNYAEADSFSLFLNSAYFVLDEIETEEADIKLTVIQPGVDFQISEQINFKLAAGLYNFANFKENADQANMTDTAGTNTNLAGIYAYDYNVTNIGFELSISKPIEMFNYLSIFAEYVSNPDDDIDEEEEAIGQLFGIKFGDKKVKEKSTWQFKAISRSLGLNAFVDFMPDSDFAGGGTGYQGLEIIFKYAIAKNIFFGLDTTQSMASKISRMMMTWELFCKLIWS